MYSFKIVFVLTLAAIGSGRQIPEVVPYQAGDRDLLLQFIECARLAIATGIPEIDLPSHSPVKITQDINYEFSLTSTIKASFSMNNMVVENIPEWEVRQWDEIMEAGSNEIYQYEIYWPKMVFRGDWALSLSYSGIKIENDGTVAIELDHVNFDGIFDFTRPEPNRAESVNALELDVTTKEVQLDITNLGQLGTLINSAGSTILTTLLQDIKDESLNEGLKDKLMNDWVKKPERIDAIISHCRK